MSFDVDVDTQPNFDPVKLFPNWIRASVVKNEKLGPHPCGVFPQAIAKDQVSGLAAIPYENAEELGYFKLDFLHLTVYRHFETRSEIEELLKIEPDWDLLLLERNVEKLFQVSKHGDLLKKLRPQSIEELADILALIRPGKQELLPFYIAEREACRVLLYMKDDSGYSFKKSHSISYAMVIVLQLHLIAAKIL